MNKFIIILLLGIGMMKSMPGYGLSNDEAVAIVKQYQDYFKTNQTFTASIRTQLDYGKQKPIINKGKLIVTTTESYQEMDDGFTLTTKDKGILNVNHKLKMVSFTIPDSWYSDVKEDKTQEEFFEEYNPVKVYDKAMFLLKNFSKIEFKEDGGVSSLTFIPTRLVYELISYNIKYTEKIVPVSFQVVYRKQFSKTYSGKPIYSVITNSYSDIIFDKNLKVDVKMDDYVQRKGDKLYLLKYKNYKFNIN